MRRGIAGRMVSLAAMALVLCFGSAAQAVTLGPGDIVPNANDSEPDLIVIDTAATAFLAAGPYTASWNYQFWGFLHIPPYGYISEMRAQHGHKGHSVSI